MSRPGFGEGVLVALAAALLASIASVALRLLLTPGEIAQVLCAGLGLGYGLYLVARSGETLGRVVLVLAWLSATLIVAGLSASLWPQLLTQLGLVWLTRTLYFHAEPLGALLDLGLAALGLASAIWALERTDSLFLAVWTLFLVQALFSMIPRRRRPSAAASDEQTAFDAAGRAADRALRRLSQGN